MASRAEAGPAPPVVAPPRLGSVVRASLTDYYFNSIRLVPVNVLWGAAAVSIVLLALAWPLGGVLLSPLLALPTAAIFAMAAAIARVEPAISVRDALATARAKAAPAILLGTGWLVANVVLLTNIVTGLTDPGSGGWLIATLAAWGVAVLWCGALVVWPLLVDPTRADRSIRDQLRLAAALLVLSPIRFGALGAFAAIVVLVSTILTAALLTISVAFVALVACHSVYPVADRLEAQLTGRAH